MLSSLSTCEVVALAAMGFGAAGLACQLTWPIMKSRRTILGLQFGIGSNYGIQYSLLDAWSGAGICFLGACQTITAYALGNRPFARKIGLCFLPLVAGVTLFTWGGMGSLFAMASCMLIMLGRMQSDTLILRSLLLAAAPIGMIYDIIVWAPLALCGATVSTIIAATMFRREYKARHQPDEYAYFAAAGMLV